MIFGAGASYGAREPRPPLGKDLHQWVLRYFEKKYNELHLWENEPGTEWENEPGSEIVRQTLKGKLKNATSYEALANTLWKERKPDLLTKLNFLLAASMTPPLNDLDDEPRVDDSFVERPDLFDEWLKKKVRNKGDFRDFTFMTLNYDCLLERAICRMFFTPDEKEGQCLCTHIHYPFIGGPETGVEVFKLHGSINWIGDPLGNPDRNGVSLLVFMDTSKKISYKDINVVPTYHGRVDLQNPDERIMATYAPGKHFRQTQESSNKSVVSQLKESLKHRVSKSLVSTYLQTKKTIHFSGSCFKQCPVKKSISLILVRMKMTWQKLNFALMSFQNRLENSLIPNHNSLSTNFTKGAHDGY